jgi:hypothetical protein
MSVRDTETRGKLILVCGSRSWHDGEAIKSRLRTFGPNAVVMHGGALGADTLAGRAAHDLGLRVWEVKADWKKYGRRAGPLRNIAMLEKRPDHVLAFWDGKSPGTKHTLDEAERRGIPRWIVPASAQRPVSGASPVRGGDEAR